jgi:L-alanine-DL-glutamate epimerase-like enolase superfamily enzyme
MATPLLIAASLHMAAASPNFAIMESAGQESGPFGNTLLKQPLLIEQGYAAVPERPGLGVEFDDEALARLGVS